MGKILFLCDVPPVESGGGNHRLSWLSVRAYREQISQVVTRRFWRRTDLWRKEVGHPLMVVDEFSGPFCRIPGLVGEWFKHRAFARGVAKLPELPAEVDRIFAFFGADALFAQSALAAKRRWNRRLEIYLVDEPVEWCRIQKMTVRRVLAGRLYRQVLKEADCVWVISEGYQRLLREQMGIEARLLPIPLVGGYVPTPWCRREPSRVVHIGSVNFLYQDALRQVLAVLGRIKRAGGVDIRLSVCTAQGEASVRSLLGSESGDERLEVVNGLNSAEIVQHCRESLGVLLPYSFESGPAIMVRTSFPTKTTEAMLSGRPIIVYSPAYGSVRETFEARGMGLVCGTESELEESLLRLAANPDRGLDALVGGYNSLADEFRRCRDDCFIHG